VARLLYGFSAFVASPIAYGDLGRQYVVRRYERLSNFQRGFSKTCRICRMV